MKKVRVAVFILVIFLSVMHLETVHGGLKDSIVRLHIIANSDSKEDQAQKLQIRDFVLKNYGEVLSAENRTEALEEVFRNIPQIESDIRHTFKTEVKAELCEENFPTKEYDGITLPAGEYVALKIKIGNAKGQNWWCVMYPPLCFSDLSTETNRDEMKKVLSKEEYELVTSDSAKVVYKFKSVELWNKFKKLF